MAETAAAREVRVVRDFAAPPERVFRAWTEPDQVAAWFGPAHVETPRDGVRIDLRVGGRYELTMLAPGGREFAIGYEITALGRRGSSSCAPTRCRRRACTSRPSCGSRSSRVAAARG
jgi:uncharacterized protein YndB with AHSA1/START domain